MVPYYAPSETEAFYSWNAIVENTKIRHHPFEPHHLMTYELWTINLIDQGTL